MKVITVASPDKVSLSMFIDFLKFCLGSRYSVGHTHSLMPRESLETYVDGFLEKYPQSILSFYSRRKKVLSPGAVIPERLLEVSEAVIWFDLYGTDPKVVKDSCGFSELFLERWKKNVDRMNRANG